MFELLRGARVCKHRVRVRVRVRARVNPNPNPNPNPKARTGGHIEHGVCVR
jgi:hypothetical protein